MKASPSTRDILVQAAADAGLSSAQFRLVGLHQHQRVLRQIFRAFTSLGAEGGQARWLWEHFVGPVESLVPLDAREFIAQLVAVDSAVWFVAEDFEGTKRHGNYWLFETDVASALAVLGQAPLHEYYLVARDLEWLVCENHHDVVIGVGAVLVAKVRSLRSG